MLVRRLRSPAVLALAIVWLISAVPLCAASDWLPISPEELAMTSEPKAPGAPAIYLYRQVDRDDQSNVEKDYVRIKVLTEEGRKQGDVEILYSASGFSISGIKARTIQPNGAIINFDGKIYDKTVIKARGIKYAAKTFTLPDVQVGSIIEYRYTIEEDRQYVFFSHWVINSDLFTRRAKFSLRLNDDFSALWMGQRLPPGVVLPATATSRFVRLEVTDVPAYVEEDYSPPENETRSIVDFIYTMSQERDMAKFWKSEGKDMYRAVEGFVGKHKEIAHAAAEIAPPGDPPDVRLRKLYEKVQSLHNTSFEAEKTAQEEKREKNKENENIMDVWKKGAGTGLQLTWLYLGLVRGAGFDASPLRLAHRDASFFHPESMNSGMLSDGIVMVKVNGQDKFFDPGTACTPFGLLPWSETDVTALRLDKDGGAWIQTPLPDSSDSRILRKAAFKLGLDGSLSGKLTLTLTGLEALGSRLWELNEDNAARKTYLEQLLQGYIPVGIEAQLTNTPAWTSSTREFVAEFNLKIPGWASAAGTKAILPIGLFDNAEKHMFEHTHRTYMVYYHFPYETVDDFTIELPPGWQPEGLPSPEKRDLGLVVYQNAVENQGGTLHFTRATALKGIFVERKNYSILRGIYEYVRKSDDQQIIITRAPAPGRN